MDHTANYFENSLHNHTTHLIGPGSPGMQAEVEWNCLRCGITNTPQHRMCYSCKKWRDLDWPCVMCGFRNFHKRDTCRECGAGHVPPYTPGQDPGGPGSGVFREPSGEVEHQAGYSALPLAEGAYSCPSFPGGLAETSTPPVVELPWLCGMCNYENTPKRILCFECSGHRDRVEVRNRAAEVRMGLSPAPAPPPPREFNPRPVVQTYSRDVSKVQYHPGGTVEDQTLDWRCTNCDNRNFAKRKECNKCKKPRGEVEDVTSSSLLPAPRDYLRSQPRGPTARVSYNVSYDTVADPIVAEDKSNDWHCSNCSNRNFAKRKECNKCKRPREEVDDKSVKFSNESSFAPKRPPLDQPIREKYARIDYHDTGSFRKNPEQKRKWVDEDRSNDWDCKNCKINNFAKKTSCFRCHKSRAECEVVKEDNSQNTQELLKIDDNNVVNLS